MALLTPVDAITNVVYGNYSHSCRRMTTNVSPLKKEYNATLPAIPFDIEKAKALLDEAGWKDSNGDGVREKIIDGHSTELAFDLNYLAAGGDWKNMALLTAEQMQKAGASVTPVPLELKIFIQRGQQHDFDMMMGSWSTSCLPEDFTQLWHTSSWRGNGANYSGFGNSGSDRLIDSIKVTLDETKRMAMIQRFQEMIYNDQPYIFLYASLRRLILHKRFGGCEFYSERPGMLLNRCRLLPSSGVTVVAEVNP
jgi:peptide/nickel transport system substrate-binding protein